MNIMYDICIYNFLNLLKKYEKLQFSFIAVNKMNVIQQIAYDIKKTNNCLHQYNNMLYTRV